eukprot:m.94137 g.94137  ORF g.94137 m.94137 type:complete len:84 (+) comp12405_c0_seq2:643-894(+)
MVSLYSVKATEKQLQRQSCLTARMLMQFVKCMSVRNSFTNQQKRECMQMEQSFQTQTWYGSVFEYTKQTEKETRLMVEVVAIN